MFCQDAAQSSKSLSEKVRAASDTQHDLEECENKSSSSPTGTGWSQRPPSFAAIWYRRQQDCSRAVPASQVSSTPPAKAHKGSDSILLHPPQSCVKTVGVFIYETAHFLTPSLTQRDHPARTLLGYPTQRPSTASPLSWLCHQPAGTQKESHFIPPRLHFLPRASSARCSCPLWSRGLTAQWRLDLQSPTGYRSPGPAFRRICHWWEQQKPSGTVGLLSLRCPV